MNPARLKSFISLFLTAALVSGIPGLDFYQAFAERGKQTVSASEGRDQGLRLPVGDSIETVVGGDLPNVEATRLDDPAVSALPIDGGVTASVKSIAPEVNQETHLVDEVSRGGQVVSGEEPRTRPGLRDAVGEGAAGLPSAAVRPDGTLDDHEYPELFDRMLQEAPRVDTLSGPAASARGPSVGDLLAGTGGPLATLQRSRDPFLAGSIFEDKVRDAELANNTRYDGVAVFDLASIVDDSGRLRPGANDKLQSLSSASIKTVLWTSATRDHFDRRYAGLAPFFDRIITRENFAPALDDGHPGLVWKDLSQLGYDWAIDGNSRLSELALVKRFVHFKVEPFNPDDPNQGDFAQAVDDMMALARLRKLKQTPSGQGVRFLRMAYDHAEIQALAAKGKVSVSVINRSPITLKDGKITRSNGGAAPAIRGFVIAAANTPDESAAARQGLVVEAGDTAVLFVDIPKRTMQKYYNGFANRWLWPLLHGKDVVQEFFGKGAQMAEAEDDYEDGYRKANEMFADKIVEVLGRDYSGSVSIEDYHLYRLALKLRDRGFNGVLEHFTHIPWPQWNGYLAKLSGLNKYMLGQIVQGLLANDVVEFHTDAYARNFVRTATKLAGAQSRRVSDGVYELSVVLQGREHKVTVRSIPISVDVEALIHEMESSEARQQFQILDRLAKDRTLISNVGARVDPTKGQPQSLEAYYNLIARDYGPEAQRPPPARGIAGVFRRFVFGDPRPPLYYAGFQLSRESIEEYANQRDRILYWAQRINNEFSKGRWDGIIRNDEDRKKLRTLPADQMPFVILDLSAFMPHPLVLATMAATNRPGARRGVGDVTPLADGMNLVAKEYIVAVANAWRMAPSGFRWLARLRQAAARFWGVGAVMMESETIGAFAEQKSYVAALKDPTSVEEREALLRRSLAAANGEAPSPKAEDGFGQIVQNDLYNWAEARHRARLEARGPPILGAEPSAASSRWPWLRSSSIRIYGAAGLGLLALSTLAFIPFHQWATYLGFAGSGIFMIRPYVLLSTTLRNLDTVRTDRSSEQEKAGATKELSGLGRRWKPLFAEIWGNLLNLPAFFAIAVAGWPNITSLLPITNALLGFALPLGILGMLTPRGFFPRMKMFGITLSFAPVFFLFPWIVESSHLTATLALVSIGISFAFPYFQIRDNRRSLATLSRKDLSLESRRKLLAEMAAITPKYLILGLLGNLIFLPVLMVSGRWYMLLGSTVAMVGPLIILYQLYRAGLFDRSDLAKIAAGSGIWFALTLGISRALSTDFWR